MRTSSGRNGNAKESSQGAAGSSSNSRNNARNGEIDAGRSGHKKKEAPTKQNLHDDFARSTDQRTGAGQGRDRIDKEVNSLNKNSTRYEPPKENDLRHGLEQKKERELRNRLFE